MQCKDSLLSVMHSFALSADGQGDSDEALSSAKSNLISKVISILYGMNKLFDCALPAWCNREWLMAHENCSPYVEELLSMLN